MHLRFLIFLAIFCTTTTWALMRQNPDPMTIASEFQKRSNYFASRKDREGLGGMFANKFVYEACDGGKKDWEVYTKVLFDYKGLGKVSTARADKRNVIFQVQYSSHTNEVMIRHTVLGWMYQNAQEMIC